MIYCQTINVERIAIHPMDDVNITEYVELVKHGDAQMFSVYIEDDEYEWAWEFETSMPSDYERIKAHIFDAVSVCNTMSEMAEVLDDIFTEEYDEILVVNECCGCECCEGCNKYNQ